MDEYRLVVRNKTDLVPSSTSSAVPEGAALDSLDELVPPEDKQDWIPKQGPDHVSSGSNNEVVAHNNRSLESGAASLVDIILIDQTHSVSAVYHNDVGSDRENSSSTFSIPPRTPSTNSQSHHHKHSLKECLRTLQFGLLPNSTVSSTHRLHIFPILLHARFSRARRADAVSYAAPPPLPPVALAVPALSPAVHGTTTTTIGDWSHRGVQWVQWGVRHSE